MSLSFAQSARLRAALALVLLAAGSVPAIASGCGADMACLEWDSSKGACPDRDAALKAMTVACTQHQVLQVRSDGELLDGDACCYQVTEIDNGSFVCNGTSGPVGAAGPGAVTSTGTGTPSCTGALPGACGSCVEPACCSLISACVTSKACVDCFNDTTTCASDPSGASAAQADALVGCMVAAQCPGDPCGVASPVPPLCTAPPDSPSGGQCVMIGGQILCNPITNEGCNTSLGEVCDHVVPGFQCVKHPPNALCNGCGASNWCAAGLTCFGSLCAKFCCDNSDCAGGVCAQGLGGLTGAVGVCVVGTPGTGGTGGLGGTGGSGVGGAGG